MLAVFSALANPHRLRILARLRERGPDYVSQLARDIGLSRPLLILHLRKLEEAGLVSHRLELSADGKALNYFTLREFAFEITPDRVVEAAKTLTPD